MKNRIILSIGLLFLFLGAETLQAQSGWKAGIVALPGVSTFFNADDQAALDPPSSQRELLPGMTGGLMLGYNAGAFAVRLNALYSQQGNRLALNSITNDNVGGIATCHYRGNEYPCAHFTSRLEYFKVPLLFGLQTGSGAIETPKHIFSFFVGVQPAFLTKAKMYSSNTDYMPPLPDNVTSYPDAFEQFSPVVFSGLLDLGFDINLDENIQMNLHIRGEYGLNDVENKDATFRLTEGGQTREIPLYDTDRPTTNSVTAGLVFGFTYNLRSRWN